MNPDDKKLAPRPLSPLQQFVNTRSLMRDYDVLESPESAAKWLTESGYHPSGGILREEEVGSLRALREGLREILISHNLGSTPQTGQAALELSQIVESAALVVNFDSSGQPLLGSSSTGIEGFMGDLMATAIWAQHTGIWQRLKVCANEECRWAFYDSSKNRSGSWCDMEICGSRAKMSAYRRRRSSETS